MNLWTSFRSLFRQAQTDIAQVERVTEPDNFEPVHMELTSVNNVEIGIVLKIQVVTILIM